jgi:hypothetical protein
MIWAEAITRPRDFIGLRLRRQCQLERASLLVRPAKVNAAAVELRYLARDSEAQTSARPRRRLAMTARLVSTIKALEDVSLIVG